MESDWQPEELIIHQMLEITEMVETDLLNVTYRNTFDPISVHGLFKGVVIRICPTFNSKQCFNAR